jgi:hypothetical protein
MNHLPRLLGYHGAIDAWLDAERRQFHRHPDKQRRIEQRQKLNDHANFVLCWGHLETHINHTCRQAIRKRASNPDWTKRRGWDLYNPEDRRLSGLSFQGRAALVLDKRGSD